MRAAAADYPCSQTYRRAIEKNAPPPSERPRRRGEVTAPPPARAVRTAVEAEIFATAESLARAAAARLAELHSLAMTRPDLFNADQFLRPGMFLFAFAAKARERRVRRQGGKP